MAEQRVNILVYRPDGTLVAQYLLGDGEHLIGRDINCPVYLDSEHISFNHAKLHLSHDGIQIEDLNSTAGTYLDGVTVRGKLRIKPGQVLQVGDLTIHLQPESEGQAGPGSRLGDGRYTLVRMLGKGGMGEVWLAKDEQLDEEVALKRLPPEVGADAMALADMQREVKKSRALSHPNIVRIHDLVMQTGEDPLISLEYVDGTDLTAIAATKTNGIFGWSDIKDWILQLVTALEYAHEEKIVHRDLKPGNIMISRKGRLKLADFGIAATVADATRRSSMEGFISGTTLYMSPQQMEGKPPKVTDDVYALGATIYELLTSRPPFYTGNVEHQVINVTPAPPSQRLAEFGFTGEIPPYVQELAMACLAKEPEGRPQTMGAIRQWIQTEGQATGVIPKPTTRTIKQPAPVAEPVGIAEEPVPAQGKAKSGMPAWMIYVMGIALVLICFIVGENCSGGKKVQELSKGGSNGSVIKTAKVDTLKQRPITQPQITSNTRPANGNSSIESVGVMQGRVICLGPNAVQPPETLGNTVVDVAAGAFHYLALRANGTVVAWGNNSKGQCNVPKELKSVKSIYANKSSSAAILNDNTIIVFGHGFGLPKSGEKLTLFSANANNSIGKYENGTLKAWGHNNHKQLEIPENLGDVTQIRAGGHGTIALRKDGSVTGWGWVANVPKDLDNVQKISCYSHAAFALKQDGTVVGWGTDDGGMIASTPKDLKNVIAVEPGRYFAAALLADGSLRTWGRWGGVQARVSNLKSRVLAIDCGQDNIVAIVQ